MRLTTLQKKGQKGRHISLQIGEHSVKMEFHPAQGYATGFPIKDARFSKLKNILFLLSDEKEGNIIENIDFKYLSNRASFMGNPVHSNQLTGAAFVVC